MSFLGNALDSLGVTEYVVKGDPKNESEFNAKFRKVVGQDAIGTAILSDDPSGFGITWKEVSDQMKIEEQKFSDMEYARNRKEEYDALNQLEMQFDDKEDGTTTWEDAIKAIKTKWPKDNSGPV